MKIAHIISTFPPRIGGMGSVCFEEVKRLAELGHEMTVFTTRYDEKALPSPTFIKWRIIRLRPFLKKGDGGWLPQLFFYLKGFDIIHLHFPFYISAHSVLFAKWFRKQKYVVTYHMDAQSAKQSKKIIQRIYDFIFAKIILSHAEKVIVVSNDYFKNSRFKKYVAENKLVEIYNGVDTEIFRPLGVETRKFASARNKKYILFVGNLMPVKRLDLLLRALNLIDDKNTKLLVVGGDYAIEKYKKMVSELKLENRVDFVGACGDKNKLVEYYNLAWCTAIPSASESFSLVALESMACGCPVIASDISGVNDRIKDGVDGWLVGGDSPLDWAAVLNKILSLSVEERNAMGEMGRKKILAEYGWEKHVESLLEVYRVIRA